MVYAKSLHEDFLWIHDSKDTFSQTTDEILETSLLNPNIESFGLPKRICISHINSNYPQSYRAQGLLFDVLEKNKPSYHEYPCDLLLFSKNEKLQGKDFKTMAQWHDISDVYWKELFPWYDLLKINKLNKSLWSHFPDIWAQSIQNRSDFIRDFIQNLRKYNWYKPLWKNNKWLMWYNECFSYEPLKVEFKGIFGKWKHIKKYSNTYNVPYYESINDYFTQASEHHENS